MRIEVPPLRYADIVDGRFQINTAGPQTRSRSKYAALSAPIRRFALAACFDAYFGYTCFNVHRTQVVVRDVRTLLEPAQHCMFYRVDTGRGDRQVIISWRTTCLTRITCD